ncbi:MAG: VOC family protein, partial [Bacteroidales bacterium]|nr:VOC family protein [Bacteroidales bacterium]
DEFIFLQEFKDHTGRPVPLDSRSYDLWFQHIAIVVTNMDKAYEILKDNRVKHVSTAPQKLPDYIPAAAGIEAFYFQDPDGHNLELIYFPAGKGNPKWKNPDNNLFAGIDHTAIAISNTPEQSLFYEKLLGLKTMGESENYGPEQERLNQVFGARLQISGLVAQNGIGLEFLEYIAPPGGRPYPASSRPDDIWHWHTTIEVANINDIFLKASQSYQMISKNLINMQETPLPYSFGFMVRDKDGHAVLILQK